MFTKSFMHNVLGYVEIKNEEFEGDFCIFDFHKINSSRAEYKAEWTEGNTRRTTTLSSLKCVSV